MKYVYYMRCSTKKQGDSGLGLDAQKAYLDHFYGNKNVIAEFVEVQSGGDVANRPKLKDAIQLCNNEGAILCIAKIDRLSRNTEQTLAIYRQLDQRLESCDIPMLDEFTLTLFSAIATREKQLIQLRTKAALDQKKLRDGEWRKGHSAFTSGKATQLSIISNKKKAAQNPNNKRAIAFLNNMDRNGKTLKQMAGVLNDNGFTTSRGKQFYPATVKMLLDRAA